MFGNLFSRKKEKAAWLELAEELNMPKDVVKALAALRPVEKDPGLDEYIEGLGNLAIPGEAENAEAGLEMALGRDPHHYKLLRCMLYAAWFTRAEYKGFLRIPDQIFLDTMGCFRRFVEECRVRTGSPDWDRGWWVWRQLSRRLFRLGALEYEWLDDEEIFAMHIPSDADLSPESVDASLEQAKTFLNCVYLGVQDRPIVCRSWLLSPALEDMLDENSNIRSFRKRFRFTGERQEEVESCLEWLFRVPPDTPYEKLPEETSLQRKAKAYLLAGGSIGTGSGILIGTEGDWEDWTWV